MTKRNAIIGYSLAALIAAIALFGFAFTTVAHADTNRGVGVFIGQNGNAYVNGATVTATSTTGVTAVTNLGGNSILWNVNASSTTRFGALGKGLISLTNIAVGDIVSFFGKFTGSGSTITVDAQVLRDKTFAKAHATTTHATSTKDHEDHEDKDNNGKHRGWFNGKSHFFLGLGHKKDD